MNFIKERGIWIIITIIIMCGLYYWVVVDEERVIEMSELEQSDYVLSGDVNEWSESNNTFERIEYKIDQINEMLNDRISSLSSELESLTEEFSSYKRASQRDAMKTKKRLDALEEKLDETINKIEED